MRSRGSAADKTQITFKGLRSSPELAQDVRERIAWLEQFSGGIMACRVWLEVPHRHRGHGRHMHVRIEITRPGSEPIVVSQEPSLQPALKDIAEAAPRKRDEIGAVHRYGHVAIREAFDTARRRLQDLAPGKREAVDRAV
jgi:hypothetical protein